MPETEKNPPRLLEPDTQGLPMEKRLQEAAGRLLEPDRFPDGRFRSLRPLRPDQVPVFRDFADYLMDLATRPRPRPADHRRDMASEGSRERRPDGPRAGRPDGPRVGPPDGSPQRGPDSPWLGSLNGSPFCRIVLPPRTGKTVIAGHIIAQTGLTAVIVVPTRTLVVQSRREIEAQVDRAPVGVFYGDEKRTVNHGVNVTTYASLLRHLEQGTLPAEIRGSALVFVDEAHHAMTELRMGALGRAFDPAAVRVALTATPDYDDRRRLRHFFQDLVHEIQLAEALSLGLLAPARAWVAEVDVDASVVRLVAGDYQQETLGRLMSTAPFFRAVQLFRYLPDNVNLPALVACSSRQQAHDLWRFLQKHRPEGRPGPGLVLGETPPRRRKELLDGFQKGRLDTLIQVGVLIEGWDAPHCKLLLDLAPSASRVRAMQKYFRVMTRYRGQEARIYVLLPKKLPGLPVLPMDLLLDPGEEYECGELLGPRRGGDPPPLLLHRRTPVKGVKLKKRILVYGRLEEQKLDRSNWQQIRRVLDSCPDFVPDRPCGRGRFERLVFQCPLFTGTGRTLLRFLGVGQRRGTYWALMARLYPEPATMAFLERQGRVTPDLLDSCRADLARVDEEIGGPSPRARAAFRPLSWLAAVLDETASTPPDPEQILLAREDKALLEKALAGLDDRKRQALELRFGLGEEDEFTYLEVGRRLGVSLERARQIVWQALLRLRRAFLSHEADHRPLDCRHEERIERLKRLFPSRRTQAPDPSWTDPVADFLKRTGNRDGHGHGKPIEGWLCE